MYFLEFEAKPISVMLPRRQKQELFSAILFPHCHHWELLTQCHLICHPNGSPHCEMHQRLRLRSRHNSKCSIYSQPSDKHCLTNSRPLANKAFFYFLLLTLKTNIFKTQSTFPGNWIVKKVATAVNGFFIHVVSKLCIFCVKLSKNQSIKRQKYNKIFFDRAAKEKDFVFRKDIEWLYTCLQIRLSTFQKGYLVHSVEGGATDSRWPIFFCHSNITPDICHKIPVQFP